MDNKTNQDQLNSTQELEIFLTLGIGGLTAAIICLVALGMLIGYKLYKFFVHRLAMYQVMAALFFAIACSLQLGISE